MKTKKFISKAEILRVFKMFPNRTFNSEDFYAHAKALGLFIPTAFNTHLSQLNKLGYIKRVGRATYILNA